MNPNDLIYSSICKGALKKGAKEHAAKDQAVLGLENYKKGKFKKPFDLIDEHVKAAVRIAKAKKPGRNSKTV